MSEIRADFEKFLEQHKNDHSRFATFLRDSLRIWDQAIERKQRILELSQFTRRLK